jgi:hypothetical protein
MAGPRRWVPYAALAALAGLLVLAGLVARTERPVVEISPSPASPGDTLTVRFIDPQVFTDELTFERDGHFWFVDDGRWLDTADLGDQFSRLGTIEGPTSSFEVTLPPEAEEGRYLVCLSSLGASRGEVSLDETSLDQSRKLCSTLVVARR